MILRVPQPLALSLSLAVVITGCKKPESTEAPAGTPTSAASQSAASTAPNAVADVPMPNKLSIDESKLPPLMRFQVSDLDPQAKPCDDLNRYANAKWLAANPVPSDQVTWGPVEMMIERSNAVQRQLVEQAAADPRASGITKLIGDLWATGMDEAKINAQGIEPIRPDLTAIDGITDRAKLIEYLRASAAEGDNPIFVLGPSPDFENSAMNIAFVNQSALALPDPEYYTRAENKAVLEAYRKHVAKVLELAGASAADAQAQAKQMVGFETRLAKVSKTSTELQRDVSLNYNPVTVAQADKLTPNWSWSEFFKSLGIAAPEKFSLAEPALYREVSKMIADTDPAIWRTYLRFHIVDSAAPYLSQPFVDENFAFYNRALLGQEEMPPRWKRVLGTINTQAGEALGQLYVRATFPPESKAKMEELVGNLRTALKTRLEKLEWMSPATKAHAIAKWNGFASKIGYPDEWRSWEGVSTSRDSYSENMKAIAQFNYKWELSKIGKAVDKTEWITTPQTVNAFYSPLQNDINYPAAFLQPPFFDPQAPVEMNYGAIGAMIGHEMTHGYDDQGARFGPTGNFEDWWTPADTARFKQLTGKLVKQFDGYTTAQGKVRGKLTLGENIADLGGLATAYDAMKLATAGQEDPKTDGLTRDQRFFLSWASVWRGNSTPGALALQLKTDEHAPDEFRANGAPSNLPAFAAAFSCKPGDKMVRQGKQQVMIW